MKALKNILVSMAFASGLAPLSAFAVPLTIVNVGAPAVNCVFNTTCTVTVIDSIGNFTLPADSGKARLQSRTFKGVAPAPAAGYMGYDYRVDLTKVKGITAANCVTKLRVNFGPVKKLPYNPKGLFDVYVVTSGGLGSVGLSSAVKTGNSITFTFSSPVCPGATSYFFGLAAKGRPKPGKARVYFSLGGGTITADRVPKH